MGAPDSMDEPRRGPRLGHFSSALHAGGKIQPLQVGDANGKRLLSSWLEPEGPQGFRDRAGPGFKAVIGGPRRGAVLWAWLRKAGPRETEGGYPALALGLEAWGEGLVSHSASSHEGRRKDAGSLRGRREDAEG